MKMYTGLLLLVLFVSGCNDSPVAADHKNSATKALEPVDVAGSTTADVSTYQNYIAALSEAFISGDENAIAAVIFPNREMMTAHILKHYSPNNAKAAIDMLDVSMKSDLSQVLSTVRSARQQAANSGLDYSSASLDSAKKLSGMSIGGMKMNTLGMNIKSGDKVYAFTLSQSRDILGRWVTMGKAEFSGVTSTTNGELNLDL
ncbi:MAG: hypothetical protein SWN10_21870 [Pseudomonadota bacterium]|nr:hypothetical protein [Pseudomonadota bacterium]